MFIAPSGPCILPKWLTESKFSKTQHLQYLQTENAGSCQCSANLKETNDTEFIVSRGFSSCFGFLLSLLAELWHFCPCSHPTTGRQQRARP